MGTIMNPPTSGSSSAITSRPSPGPVRWWVRRWRRSSVICPSVYWIIIGAVLGGAVQDFVILFCSMRRDGKTLGQMARDEIGKTGGFTALLAVLFIMIILLAVVALVVVNALKGSPWGTFTIAATMPIALFMGVYLRYWRPGKVLECSTVGFVLVIASIFGGQAVANSPVLAPWFTLSATSLAHRDHHLRIPFERAAGLAVPCAARLPEHLHQAGRGGDAGGGHPAGASHAATARLHALRRRHRADLRGQGVSVRLHHHRVRRGFGISCADLVGHHAQDDRARMERVAGGLRLHVAGRFRRDHGADRRLLAAARRFLRREFAARRGGSNSGGRGLDDFELGLSGFSRRHECAGGRRRREDAVLSHRRRAVAGARNGAHFSRTPAAAARSWDSGITSRSCSRRCSS